MGIIGATGSGKTTIINLLMRFYDVDSGSITINQRDVREFSEEELHAMFGAVFQNDMLFEDSIYENINIGRDLKFEEIEKASEYAQIKTHITAMRDGFDSVVAIKGANLSGGQKQRMLIARALANNPQILVLDDSSSALDYKTDSVLRKQINNNLKDTTKIIVAQRVSSVMNSDVILVIDDGEQIALGTHEELMMTCQMYREISNLQMGQ